MLKSCIRVKNCQPSTYVNCVAYQQKKNCFEVEWTPCCRKHRSLCVSCPTYIEIQEVEKESQAVVVYTDLHRIEGSIHIPVGLRLLDALNTSDKRFVAITDATITPLVGNESPLTDQFVIVQREHIVSISPR